MVDIRWVCVLSVENALKRLKINEESRKWAEKSKMGEKSRNLGDDSLRLLKGGVLVVEKRCKGKVFVVWNVRDTQFLGEIGRSSGVVGFIRKTHSYLISTFSTFPYFTALSHL